MDINFIIIYCIFGIVIGLLIFLLVKAKSNYDSLRNSITDKHSQNETNLKNLAKELKNTNDLILKIKADIITQINEHIVASINQSIQLTTHKIDESKNDVFSEIQKIKNELQLTVTSIQSHFDNWNKIINNLNSEIKQENIDSLKELKRLCETFVNDSKYQIDKIVKENERLITDLKEPLQNLLIDIQNHSKKILDEIQKPLGIE